MIHHAFIEHRLEPGQNITLFIAPIFEFGRSAVGIFIVLSGFCLMLPVARSLERQLRSATIFLKRRAWRILPPYYLAIVVSLLCIKFVLGMDVDRGVHRGIALPVFSRYVLLSHLLLVHDLSFRWAYKINHALWSIATESQIYVLFAFVLLPIWRRAGIAALLVFTIGGGIACFYLGPSLRLARPSYVGLFAMGMVAALISVSQ